MEEVDNIIIHTLKSLGCSFGEEVKTLTDFSPELLVETVSSCIQLIDPSINLPKTLPSNLAQRFSATASIADACVVSFLRCLVLCNSFGFCFISSLWGLEEILDTRPSSIAMSTKCGEFICFLSKNFLKRVIIKCCRQVLRLVSFSCGVFVMRETEQLVPSTVLEIIAFFSDTQRILG